MSKETSDQSKGDAPREEEKALDKSLDKKRFTIREVWLISTTVVTAAIGLAVAVIRKDAEIKIEIASIRSSVQSIKELQEERNINISNEIEEIKEEITQLRTTIFKSK
jgi:hypothetical protein